MGNDQLIQRGKAGRRPPGGCPCSERIGQIPTETTCEAFSRLQPPQRWKPGDNPLRRFVPASRFGVNEVCGWVGSVFWCGGQRGTVVPQGQRSRARRRFGS